MSTPTDQLYCTEIFSAIQGEGAYVGERQVFLRLAGCNIRCGYCDQPEALERRAGSCRIETVPGARNWVNQTSPLPLTTLRDAIVRLTEKLSHHSVSVTGGEPLFQAAALAGLVTALRAASVRVHLETNGTLLGGLRRVAPVVDHVSMDLKLPSVDGAAVPLSTAARFLEIALNETDTAPRPAPRSSRAERAHRVSVKIVLGPATDEEELDAAVTMVHATEPTCEIFLQPVTPFGTVLAAPSPAAVLQHQARALEHHERVRVIPQTHRMIGQL